MKNLTNLVRLEISDTLPCYNQSMISDDIFYGPKALTVLHIVESIKCTRFVHFIIFVEKSLGIFCDVWCGMAWCGMVRYGMARYDVAWCDVV